MDPAPTLSLALRVDGESIFILLTDFRGLACQGWAPATVAAVCAAVQAGATPRALQTMVLPDAVTRAIATVQAGALTVQLPVELDPLPIERFEAGSGPWGACFAITRQLALDRPAPAMPPAAATAEFRLRPAVLVVGSRAVRSQPAVQALEAVADVAWAQLSGARDDQTGDCADVIVMACADAARRAVARAGAGAMAPAMWVWSALAGDLEAVVALRSGGHAVLLAPPALSPAQLLEAVASWLQACAQGVGPAGALRTVADALPDGARPSASAAEVAGAWLRWRLYHAEPRPLCRPPPVMADAATAGVGAAADEHRQVTALSFDLVDSTALIARLGDEGYSETIARMHALCVDCVHGRGGSVADRKDDDGSMACFGVPRALEDASVRGLDAALAMQSAVSGLPGRPQLRIGVATGRIAVRGGVPYGTPLHLAARLRQRAAPGEVMVDEATRRLARQHFDFERLPVAEHLKGITEDVWVSRLAGRRIQAPFDAPALTRFVGREADLAELRDRWARAAAGGVVSVVMHGDAGVGKSRLVSEFLDGLRADGGRFIALRGLPETQGSAFRTLADALQRSLDLRHDDSASIKQAVLARALPQAMAEPSILHRLGRLLDVGQPPRVPVAATQERLTPLTAGHALAAGVVSGLASTREREDLITALVEVLVASAVDSPLAVVVEDLPRVDPSTREVLQRVIDTPHPARLLVLCTQRDDESAPPLKGAEMLALGRLSPAASRWLIREAVGDALSPELMQRLAERADGIPLFLEESALMAVDAGGRPGAWLAEVPSSLDGLLMARIDRLGPRGKPLSQVAAVLGRDFPAALLDAVVADPDLPLVLHDPRGQLAALGSAGVLRVRDAGGVPRLAFRHELMRDVVYLSLWQRDRVALHAAAARALVAHFAAAVVAQPDWLAHHLAGAGRHAEAVTLWERAARAAAATSANREAIRHLRAALDSLAHSDATQSRDANELRLLLQLASRLIAADGYGADEVGRVYTRAAKLAADHGDAVARGKVLLGLETVHVMRGELDRAEALAAQALAGAVDGDDAMALMQARWALANVRFHAGDSRSALALFDLCLASYTPSMHHPAAVQDPGVMCLCYSAWALWEQGRADAALRRADDVVALARSLRHRFSLGEAYGFAASIALFRGEIGAGLRWGKLAVELCEDAGFTVWLAHARVVRGRLRALAGDKAGGRAEMEAGYRLWVATGASITRPFYLSLLAEMQLEAGDVEGAMRRVDEARAIVERTGERYHEAELLRLAAQGAWMQGDEERGDALLHRSLTSAAAGGKWAFGLRAAIAYGERLAARGYFDRACVVVEEAQSHITEGLATRDPRRARALLARWRALPAPRGGRSLRGAASP